MPDHQGRQDFPEVNDEKINIGNFKEWSRLGQADIYSPKEEPKLRDQIMLDQEQMLKELVSMIEGLGKKSAKKVEDPYKGSSIQKGIAGNPGASKEAKAKDAKQYKEFKDAGKTPPLTAPNPMAKGGKKTPPYDASSEEEGFDLCAKCGDKGDGIEKGGVCKACVTKTLVKTIDNYLG